MKTYQVWSSYFNGCEILHNPASGIFFDYVDAKKFMQEYETIDTHEEMYVESVYVENKELGAYQVWRFCHDGDRPSGKIFAQKEKAEQELKNIAKEFHWLTEDDFYIKELKVIL